MITELDYLERIMIATEKCAEILQRLENNRLFKEETNKINELNNKNVNEAWVVEPYTICLTSLPPKYVSRILHYKSSNEFNSDMLKKYGSERVFESEEEAITFCKVSLGTTYEIIDVPEQKSTVVINDDIK